MLQWIREWLMPPRGHGENAVAIKVGPRQDKAIHGLSLDLVPVILQFLDAGALLSLRSVSSMWAALVARHVDFQHIISFRARLEKCSLLTIRSKADLREVLQADSCQTTLGIKIDMLARKLINDRLRVERVSRWILFQARWLPALFVTGWAASMLWLVLTLKKAPTYGYFVRHRWLGLLAASKLGTIAWFREFFRPKDPQIKAHLGRIARHVGWYALFMGSWLRLAMQVEGMLGQLQTHYTRWATHYNVLLGWLIFEIHAPESETDDGEDEENDEEDEEEEWEEWDEEEEDEEEESEEESEESEECKEEEYEEEEIDAFQGDVEHFDETGESDIQQSLDQPGGPQ